MPATPWPGSIRPALTLIAGRAAGASALAGAAGDDAELASEAADLIYHLLVLLQDQDLDLSAVIGRLR